MTKIPIHSFDYVVMNQKVEVEPGGNDGDMRNDVCQSDGFTLDHECDDIFDKEDFDFSFLEDGFDDCYNYLDGNTR